MIFMKVLKYFVLILAISLFCSCSSSKQGNPIAIMAYYVPEQDYQPETLPLDQLTHIIFSFTKVIDGEMKFRNEESGAKLKALVAQRKNHPNLKVMVACGGWAADGFSDMVYTAESRAKFVQSVGNFIKDYNLDGIDIDWEYPTIPAGGTKARPEDKENFTRFMKSLREALDTLKRKQTITFATPGYKGQYQNIELNKVMNYVNYINVMTYDQRVASAAFAGHHTALGWIKKDDMKSSPALAAVEAKKEDMAAQGKIYEPESAEMIVDYLIKQGVKPEQIVIGAAFYGRIWKGVPPVNNGLYQPTKGPVRDAVIYKDIRNDYETNANYKRYWDSVAKAPYLYSSVDSVFITYDDTTSVKLKTEFALKEKLGGIMFWQLGHDTKEKNSLLKAIYDTSKEEESTDEN